MAVFSWGASGFPLHRSMTVRAVEQVYVVALGRIAKDELSGFAVEDHDRIMVAPNSCPLASSLSSSHLVVEIQMRG